jgi:dipeptidyl aminopeptidase/acylaminoacyl peptidase
MRLTLSIIFLMTMITELTAQQLAPPKAITDPKQITAQAREYVQAFTIDKLYSTRAIGGTAWSPDARQIAFISNISGRNNLWLVGTAGDWPTQLTVSDQRQAAPAWSPNGKYIAYMSDTDGNEQWDIFLVSPESGKVYNMTNTPEVSEESPVWSADSRFLAYSVKPKDSPTYEIDVMNVTLRSVRHLTTGTPKDLGNFGPIWSRDGRWIAYTQQNAAGKDSNIFLAEVESGKSVNLTAHTGEQQYSAADFSPDGKTLLITSNAANGYDNVGLLDIASKKITWLTRDKWEIEAGNFSPDGRKVSFTANVDGNTEIFLHDLATKTTTALKVAAGVNTLGGAESAFSRDGKELLFYHNGPTAPTDAWVYSFASGKARQVTHSLVGGLNPKDMVEPFLVHFPSRDGKWQISAFVYVPYNARRTLENAGVVYIHGGPTSQTVNSFNRTIQYLVNQGYFVIAPNYRGSTGYGKEFQDANLHDMGGGDLEDVLAAADFLKQTGFMDPKKMAVMGGSYGGYMTMMAVTKAPEEWAAGVAIVPFVNWFTEVEHEDPLLQQYDLATMGDPVKDKARFEERSPIHFVDRIKAPLLLLAGGNDPRCPKEEAQQVADAVSKRGGVAELKIYENEGHGFARVPNQIDAYTRVGGFLKRYVKPADCGCTLE